MANSTLATGTAVACLLVAAVASAEVTKIKCESTNDKYHYCSVKTDNQVLMLEQISETRCEQGKSWGYDKDGVWVDHNCAAEFQVGRAGPRPPRRSRPTPRLARQSCRRCLPASSPGRQ